MNKYKKIFTNVRVIIALAFILIAIWSIQPRPWNSGVAIRNVIANSSASLAGIQNPTNQVPMKRERIIAVDDVPVRNLEDYDGEIAKLQINQTVRIRTNRYAYTILVGEKKDIGLRVYEAPKTNLRKGLDLQGGTRVLLQPEKELSPYEIDTLMSSMRERLNVYGLSDLTIRDATDLSQNQYILVEIAGATEEEVKDLLARQGKFASTIANKTVFSGGKDIVFVCRSPECSGLDPNVGCIQRGQWLCRFRFSITLSREAAERHAAITKDIPVITDENREQYLAEKLILYLDDKEVDQLNIGAELKGKASQEIAISGSGAGNSQQEAAFNSLKSMKRLQTILITGSLPVKLNIVKTDAISPVLGEEFTMEALLMAVVAAIAVVLVLFLRYRKIQIVAPVIATMLAEITILLGSAALIGWNLDLAAIAGIIIVIGAGVNDQIVITDETLHGTTAYYNWKERVKAAFFIVIGAALTIIAAMIPLIFAGAGLLKGFAITTIIGVLAGVLITRPAFASVIEILLKE